jgi:hypothetical protein
VSVFKKLVIARWVVEEEGGKDVKGKEEGR